MDRPESRLAAPAWLVRAGTTSWLALGVAGLATLVVLTMSTFTTIVFPIIYAAVGAALALPLVDRLAAAGVSRTLGALVGLGFVVGLAAGGDEALFLF